MSHNINITYMGNNFSFVTPKKYQYDYGQQITFSGIELPQAFEVHFSNEPIKSTAEKSVGTDYVVEIPNKYFDSGRPIYGWIFLTGQESGQTEYTFRIPIAEKPQTDPAIPTPAQQDVVTQAINALNDAVEHTAADVVVADASAQAALASELNASTSEDNAALSATAAATSEGNALTYAQNASASATTASGAASDASGYATTARQAATAAASSAESAAASAQAIEDMTVSATTLQPGSDATVTKSTVEGVVHLAYGIPAGAKGDTGAKGDKGDKGDTGATGATGQTGATGATPNLTIGTVSTLAPGESATATITGTAENPVISFGIPEGEKGEKGDTGDVSQEEFEDAINDLKSHKVDSTMMQKCVNIEVAKSANLWNPDTSESGIAYIDGRILTDATRCYNVIAVEEGHVYYYWTPGRAGTARWTAAYDENGAALSAYGINANSNSFTVPSGSGIKYIAPTFGAESNVYTMVLKDVSTQPSVYISYSDSFSYYEATDEFLKSTSVSKDKIMQRTLCNLINPTFPNTPFANGGGFEAVLNGGNGTVSANSSYWTTDYIPVEEGETLYLFTRNLSRSPFSFVCGYDKDKKWVSAASNAYSYIIPKGAKYIRFSMAFSTSWTYYLPEDMMLCGTGTPSAFVEYDESLVNKYEFKPDMIPDISTSANLHVYFPSEICVGIGRTIELYNSLVCLEAAKYHLHYSCPIGVQYERKFSITGSTAGTHTLTLNIYNDNMEMVWTGQSSVKVVANSISNQLKVLPIGDSLTNLKAWLGEVQTLSNSKILFIGTRGRDDSPIRHEGRSGFSAEDYAEDTEYTFDSNYQGNPSVDGDVNPFWDGSKFSLAYYNTQQASTVGTADAVMLFLGTNDIFGGSSASASASHIKALVDAIRADYSTIPIFVCNTIYRSNQSGYYSSGGQGFSAASGWAFDSDMKIMKLQNALAEALTGYTNLYIIPLSVCMDREYDFGVNAVSVNPRLTTVTENIPSESVHPQEAGYMQIADVMYSSFMAHLT